MKRARRVSRVGTKPTNTNTPSCDGEDDNHGDKTRPSQRFTSVTVRPKPKPELESKPKLESTPILDNMTILPCTFFQVDALDLAPRLLGKFLRRDDVVLQITEVISSQKPNIFLLLFSLCISFFPIRFGK